MREAGGLPRGLPRRRPVGNGRLDGIEFRTMSNAKYRVLIADDLSKRAVEILSSHPEIAVEVKTGLKGGELAAAMKGVHAVAVRSATKITAEVVEAADALKIVG